jgi:hypothetical protein
VAHRIDARPKAVRRLGDRRDTARISENQFGSWEEAIRVGNKALYQFLRAR